MKSKKKQRFYVIEDGKVEEVSEEIFKKERREMAERGEELENGEKKGRE